MAGEAQQTTTNKEAAKVVLSLQTDGVKDEMKKELCGPADTATATDATALPITTDAADAADAEAAKVAADAEAAKVAADAEAAKVAAASGGRRRSRRRSQKKPAKKSKKGGRSRKNCGSKNRRKYSRRR
jgi:hypothetical protein